MTLFILKLHLYYSNIEQFDMINGLTESDKDEIRAIIRDELTPILKALDNFQHLDENLSMENRNQKKEILHEDEDELLDRKSAEKLLKISNATLSKFIKEGLLPPHTLGKKHFYLKSDVQYLENILNARGWYERNTNNRNRSNS